ncbi:DUF421 domain-containing protein [Leptotrichia sp. OH3620_COT-345]|uniref:DUF421 domain-containing protein n=1 Tax=Leptotrichia sp. OH3620_COT-345 TaxID=2491048 RepID=UPI000F64709A|nr:DUF421 domain-containing protein [Leptotrichia sp. OH3620_COT-345]RRD41007.1 DUF421 domain-containing protein [Leptotrichia sp. OH3620_COT-345]
MPFIISMAIKLTIGFSALVLFMNLNGKGQLAPLSTGDQIGNYVLGGIIGGVIYNPSITIVQFLMVLLIWGLLMTAINFLKNTSTEMKNIIDGQIITLVKDGKMATENFAKASMSILDFYTKLRMKGVYKVSDIEEAFTESNGQITIIKKEDNLGIMLIAEGKIIESNLEHVGKDIRWLVKKLNEKGIESIENIFLAEISGDDLFIVKKE